MSYSRFVRCLRVLMLVVLSGFPEVCALGQSVSNVNLRVMAANLNGDSMTIEPYAIRIFQGLKPDVVAIQEFRYGGNSAAELRGFVDTAFGTNFVYYREPGYSIPNGIISRHPILEAGSWDDAKAPDRGFAWTRIDVPGTNDLYLVSVHFLTSNASDRAAEANELKGLILSAFPAGAWIIVAGDFNTDSRSESAVTSFGSFLSDWPVPTDAEVGGDPDTNNGRDKPYDYVLVSWSMTNRMTNTVFGSRSFARGLVFDSRVYTPLSDVWPVTYSDSGNGQHMGVLKDFDLVMDGAGFPGGGAPVIVGQPQGLSVVAGSSASFTVSATGDGPLSYIWSLNGGVLTAGSSSSYTIASAQVSNAGAYSVVVTNGLGRATSEVAVLTVTVPSTGTTGALAGWNVAGLGFYGPSPFPATTVAPGVSVTGLTRGPGVKTLQTAATNSWGGNDLATASVEAAVAAGDYVWCAFSVDEGRTVSFREVSAFSYKRSNAGPVSGLLQYQVGSGDFVNVAGLSFSSTSGASLAPIDLSGFSDLQSVGEGTSVTFRVVIYGTSNAGGNWYFTDPERDAEMEFAFSGVVQTVAGPPAVAPEISNVSASAGGIQFLVTGTAGSNYVVEATSDLAAGSWQGVETNRAPFMFSESNGAASRRFFRGRVAVGP